MKGKWATLYLLFWQRNFQFINLILGMWWAVDISFPKLHNRPAFSKVTVPSCIILRRAPYFSQKWKLPNKRLSLVTSDILSWMSFKIFKLSIGGIRLCMQGSTVENPLLVIKSSKKDFCSPQAHYLWFSDQTYLAYIIFSLRGRREKEEETFIKIVLTSKYFLLPVL